MTNLRHGRAALLVLTALVLATTRPTAAPLSFPAGIGKSVRDYGARGDGVTDDTKAIRDALADGRSESTDYYGRPKFLYFPAGTYLVSDTLVWQGCAVTIQGQGAGVTVFKLKDRAPGYGSPSSPKAVWKTPAGNMAFRHYFHDLTINVGSGNPGAIALDYISSNTGAVTNVELVAPTGSGLTGLDMTRQWPGPLLVRDLVVSGFRFGIKVANAEYGPTFEHIRVSGQDSAGICNDGNVLAIRDFASVNSAPAVLNRVNWGYVILVSGVMSGGAASTSAIVSEGLVYCRNLAWSGYGAGVDQKGTLVKENPVVEFISDSVRQLFPGPKRSLGLPIQETPEYHDADTTRWAQYYGNWYGDMTHLQELLNSGKSTLYFPGGVHFSYQTTYVKVPKSVRRIIGFHSVINHDVGREGIMFQVEENSSDPLIVEQFGYGVGVEHTCGRPVVIRNGAMGYYASAGAGNLFIEDVVTDSLVFHPGQKVWMRQLNTEGDKPHIANNGAALWVLGIKTEGKGTVIKTMNKGRTEVLGTLLYPCQSFTSTDGPAFISEESAVSFMYRVSSYVSKGGYLVQVDETRGGVRKQLTSNGDAMIMPLFAGFDSTDIPVRNGMVDRVGGGQMVGPALRVAAHGGAIRGGAGTRDLCGRTMRVGAGGTVPERAAAGVYVVTGGSSRRAKAGDHSPAPR